MFFLMFYRCKKKFQYFPRKNSIKINDHNTSLYKTLSNKFKCFASKLE